MDKFPLVIGHIEVVSKRHAVSIIDLTPEEWKYLQLEIKESIDILENKLNLREFYKNVLKNTINKKSKKFLLNAINSQFIDKNPNAYNHGNNDGEVTSRTISHFH